MPLISVLIPARNEEANIQNILSDLKKQSYSNIEVIIFNDQSTDNTRKKILACTKNDNRFSLIDSHILPNGWLGKNNACSQLAKYAKGKYLLFVDADVRIRGGLLESSLAQMDRHKLKLLSIFPKQIMLTTSEKITVPLMNMILLSLLPMVLTRTSSYPSLAAANGQFMMFEKKTYLRIQPHEKVKSKPVEDILIARLYKTKGLKLQCMTGNSTIQCRMYKNFKESVRGFARNMPEFFGGNHFAAIIYWLLGTFGIFVVIFCMHPLLAIATILMIIGTRSFISVTSRQSVIQNFIFAIPQQIIMGWIIIISLKNKLSKTTKWKGRNIG